MTQVSNKMHMCFVIDVIGKCFFIEFEKVKKDIVERKVGKWQKVMF